MRMTMVTIYTRTLNPHTCVHPYLTPMLNRVERQQKKEAATCHKPSSGTSRADEVGNGIVREDPAAIIGKLDDNEDSSNNVVDAAAPVVHPQAYVGVSDAERDALANYFRGYLQRGDDKALTSRPSSNTRTVPGSIPSTGSVVRVDPFDFKVPTPGGSLIASPYSSRFGSATGSTLHTNRIPLYIVAHPVLFSSDADNRKPLDSGTPITGREYNVRFRIQTRPVAPSNVEEPVTLDTDTAQDATAVPIDYLQINVDRTRPVVRLGLALMQGRSERESRMGFIYAAMRPAHGVDPLSPRDFPIATTMLKRCRAALREIRAWYAEAEKRAAFEKPSGDEVVSVENGAVSMDSERPPEMPFIYQDIVFRNVRFPSWTDFDSARDYWFLLEHDGGRLRTPAFHVQSAVNGMCDIQYSICSLNER